MKRATHKDSGGQITKTGNAFPMPAALSGPVFNFASPANPATVTCAALLLFLVAFLLLELHLTSPLPSTTLLQKSENNPQTPQRPGSSEERMNQFSLWAMPPEGSQFHARASAAIQVLSKKMNCTPFEPHVTVIGAFGANQGLDEAEVVRRTKQLCASLKPYKLDVQELSSGQTFFQCVFLKMVPSETVLGVNKKAREIMGMSLGNAYMPHMSLVYGDLSESQKAEVKETVAQDFSDLFKGISMSFPVHSLALYRTDPDDWSMASWERLAVFSLGG